MSVIGRWLASHPSNPDPWMSRFFRGQPSATGMFIDAETAERNAAVFSAVRLLAETIGTLPLHLFKRLEDDGKERYRAHRVYHLLHDAPNPWQSPFEFKEMMTAHAVLRGHSFAQIVTRMDGEIEMLVPLHPGRISVIERERDEETVYRYQPKRGEPREFRRDQLFKILAHSTDGWLGRSPVDIARDAIGLAVATEEFGARFFASGTAQKGVLTHPQKLSPDAKKNLKQSWQEMNAGLRGSHGVAVLDEGLTWTQIGMRLDDAQYLETRKFQVTEIARLFRVPPHMIADLERSTFSNIEHQGQEFVTYSLSPWLVRWEQAIWRDLLTEPEQDAGIFAEYHINSLLRGDTAARFNAYNVAINSGWMTRNEARVSENRNPLPGLDDPLQPLNMVKAGEEPPPPARPPAPPATDPRKRRDEEEQEEEDRAARLAILKEPLHRAARREQQVIRDAVKRQGAEGVFSAYDGHIDYLVAQLLPVAQPVARWLGVRKSERGDALVAAAVAGFADALVSAAHAQHHAALKAAADRTAAARALGEQDRTSAAAAQAGQLYLALEQVVIRTAVQSAA